MEEEAVIKVALVACCLILTVLAACDNVNWGGAEVTIVKPPPKASGQPRPGVEPGAGRLPDGPVLYHVTAAGDGSARLIPVAEIAADSLLPVVPAGDVHAWNESFMSRHLRQGSEFVLFHDGVRAGTFVTQSASADEGACRPVPVATGTLELGSGAAGVHDFLALARVQAPQIQRRTNETLTPTRTMRVLAPILADHMLRTRNAPLPGNWERAQAQLKPFPIPGSQDPAFAATYLVGDTLGPGLDDIGQSLFFVAVPARLGYDTVFVRFRDYETGGKEAPAVLDYLDWTRDDMPELLLKLYGTGDDGYAAVGRGANGTWRMLLEERCTRNAAADSLRHDSIPARKDTTS